MSITDGQTDVYILVTHQLLEVRLDDRTGLRSRLDRRKFDRRRVPQLCGVFLLFCSHAITHMSSLCVAFTGYDCVGGALTGTFCAFIAYRKTFAAIWDFRFNHVLLPRKPSPCLSEERS